MTRIVEGLNWTVIKPDGERVAATRYAIDAVYIALRAGPGACVRHGRRTVLEIEPGMHDDRTGEVAGKLADLMIERVYGKRLRSGAAVAEADA